MPEMAKVTAAAVTHETSNGSRLPRVKSIINTSRVKTRPAMGALNIPLTAPAAPHPTRSIIFLESSLKTCPKVLPMAEPVSTIGASAPTLPPKPMVMPEATTEDQVL